MGWAKYCEDNIEIMLERQFMMQKTEITVAFRTNSSVVTTMNSTAYMIHKEANKPKYEDRYIVCKDCGRKFLFSAKSQRYFDMMDWDTPKRCKSCRNYRNARYLMCSSF